MSSEKFIDFLRKFIEEALYKEAMNLYQIEIRTGQEESGMTQLEVKEFRARARKLASKMAMDVVDELRKMNITNENDVLGKHAEVQEALKRFQADMEARLSMNETA